MPHSTEHHVQPHDDVASLMRRVAMLEELRAAEDVLLRFAAGQDRGDKALFASAFHEHAVLDFIQPAERFGIALAPFSGKQAIVETVFQNISPVLTSHTVTNQRIGIERDKATGTALVEAQHVLRTDPSRRLLLKNVYDFDLVRAGSDWQMTRLVIRTIWHDGEATVLFPG